MFKKVIVVRNSLITFCCLLVMLVVGGVLVNAFSIQSGEKQVVAAAEMLKKTYEKYGDAAGLEGSGVRLTLIDKDGNVSYDSDEEITENHLDREEVQAALNGESKVVERISSTVGRSMMYYAVTASYDGKIIIIRTALAKADVISYIWVALSVLLGCMLTVLAVQIIVAESSRRSILKPFKAIERALKCMSRGSSVKIVADFKDSEVNSTLKEIDLVAGKINGIMEASKAEKEQLKYIVENLGQGLVVVGDNMQTLVKNTAAEQILGKLASNFSESNIDERVLKAVTETIAAQDTASSLSIEKEGSIYEVSTSGTGNSQNRYAIVTIRNVTDVAQSERSRREFFANASHELKTPLTSIRGFAEMIYGNMAKGKEVAYSEKILTESERMLTLIDDMLALSHLEEGERVETQNAVDLSIVAKNVIASLAPQAEKKNVRIDSQLEEVIITGHSQHFTELIQNLVDNAIKYNNENGTVTVTVRSSGGKALIAVADTGIGIPYADRSRIFERFYRVDKGRSRQSGGTGLGLAIVKHIAAKYGANISLKSREGKGTEITVAF